MRHFAHFRGQSAGMCNKPPAGIPKLRRQRVGSGAVARKSGHAGRETSSHADALGRVLACRLDLIVSQHVRLRPAKPR